MQQDAAATAAHATGGAATTAATAPAAAATLPPLPPSAAHLTPLPPPPGAHIGHPPNAPPGAALVPGYSTGYEHMGDHGNPQVFVNLAGGACRYGSWIIGWPYDQAAANEKVYWNYAGNGWWTIHFAQCGNDWCVWAPSNSNGAGLILAKCNSADYRDLWTASTAASVYQVYDDSAGLYMTGWCDRCRLSHYIYDGSGRGDWTNYFP